MKYQGICYEGFLGNKYQWVILKGLVSRLDVMNAKVLKDSIICLLFFLVYINDLSTEISSYLYYTCDISFLDCLW